MRLMTMLAAAVAAALIASPAHATKRSHHRHHAVQQTQQIIVCDHQGCHDRKVEASAPARRVVASRVYDANGNDDERVVGGRPSACAIRLGHSRRLIPFCACAISVRVFGKAIPELFLASNWRRKFRHVAPAPNMVAARSGHAFLLLSHVSGKIWRVWDANSGGGKIRVHDRSIAGYTIVDPHQPISRMAMN